MCAQVTPNYVCAKPNYGCSYVCGEDRPNYVCAAQTPILSAVMCAEKIVQSYVFAKPNCK